MFFTFSDLDMILFTVGEGEVVVYGFFSREEDNYEIKMEKAMVDRRITLSVAHYQQQQ